MQLSSLFAAACLALTASAGYIPVRKLDQVANTYTLRWTQMLDVNILDKSTEKAAYNVFFNARLFFGTDINITDVATSATTAYMRGRFFSGANPFDLDNDVVIDGVTDDSTSVELDFDYFYIWNKFDIEVKSRGPNTYYKTMCGLQSKDCDIVRKKKGDQDQVVARFAPGEKMHDFTLEVTEQCPKGVALLASVVWTKYWNDENLGYAYPKPAQRL